MRVRWVRGDVLTHAKGRRLRGAASRKFNFPRIEASQGARERGKSRANKPTANHIFDRISQLIVQRVKLLFSFIVITLRKEAATPDGLFWFIKLSIFLKIRSEKNLLERRHVLFEDLSFRPEVTFYSK